MNLFNKMKWIIPVITILLAITACQKKDNSDTPNIQETEKDLFTAVEHLGVCYGPYHYDSLEPLKQTISKAQIESDLTLISKHFGFLRTYTVADGMDQVVEIAATKGLEVALGVNCYPGDATTTKSDIDKAIEVAKAHPSVVMCIAIGNETNKKGPTYVEPSIVAGYMDYAHTKMLATGLSMPLTACITGTGAQHPHTIDPTVEVYAGEILQKCKDLNKPQHQVVLLTIYPYWGNSQPDNIDVTMNWSYNNGISNCEENFGLTVIIGEIGWPSKNNPTSPRETVTNMETNFGVSLKWVNGNNFLNKAYNSFWFEMFDEPFKYKENGVGPYWGLYGKGGKETPKFDIPKLN